MFKFIKKLFSFSSKKTTNENNLSQALAKTSSSFSSKVVNLLSQTNHAELFKELEKTLIQSDIGITITNDILSYLKKMNLSKKITEIELKEILAARILISLEKYQYNLSINENNSPQIIMVNGINGVGKTTTVAKLAYHYKELGYSVMVAACDTFRAAAVEQLNVWSKTIGVEIITPDKEGADPAAVAYKALIQAKEKNIDILLIDTAGRLQNKSNLMDELKKISLVLQKIDPSAPHNSLLILDATIGQNAKSQLKLFQEAVDINGLIITKLDGTSKGGIIISLITEFDIPVHYIGIGEKEKDLKLFNAEEFIRSLLDLTEPSGKKEE